jgi:hypothetical protein
MKRYTMLPLVLLTSIAFANESWTINSQAEWEQHHAAKSKPIPDKVVLLFNPS